MIIKDVLPSCRVLFHRVKKFRCEKQMKSEVNHEINFLLFAM